MMRGIILSGGAGSRLAPLTTITSKQLLPVYNRPMVFYPLNTLRRAGITEILIIVAPEYAGHYMNLLGSGKKFGAKFTYEIQDNPRGGIAESLRIGAEFVGSENVALILGDNIFEDDFSEAIKKFRSGATVFVKHVPDPERFGVVRFDESSRPVEIVEKPKTKISDYAITGLYLYDARAVGVARDLAPSTRGELEITDVHNWYLKRGELVCEAVKGEWMDAGTFESLFEAQKFSKERLQDKFVF